MSREVRQEPSPAQVEFVTSSAGLSLKLTRRPFPDSDNDWDRDAIDAVVSVEVHPFEGEFENTIWSHELEALRSLLLKLHTRKRTTPAL